MSIFEIKDLLCSSHYGKIKKILICYCIVLCTLYKYQNKKHIEKPF